MRVLHVTSHLNIGGITRYLLSLSKHLVARGHHVIVASGGGQCASEVEALGAVHWHAPLRTKADFSPQVLWAAVRLSQRLRRAPVDVIHAHTRVGQVTAHLLSRWLKIPYVTTWHGVYRRRLGRRLWPCLGEATIAISHLVERHLLDDFRVPRDRVRLICNGVDVGHFSAAPDPAAVTAYRAQWQIPDHRPVIGSMGRLAAGGVKGFDLLLAAASHLAREVPDLEVLVVGDGPRRAFLEGEARRLGMAERVHFVGLTRDVRIPLALMEVFVFSSRWPEGFGLTLIEAMASGRPVIATRTGAVTEVIEHGRNGWLVPPEDPQALAQGIRQLLADRAVARQLGRSGQARVRERFTLERVTDEVEKVYREVVRPGVGE